MRHNPTTIIKCTFSNEVHKILEPNINMKTSQRWRNQKIFTDAEKLEMFNKIMELHKETSKQLTSYQFDKRQKKRIQKARIERGAIPKSKKKMSKEQYEINEQLKLEKSKVFH